MPAFLTSVLAEFSFGAPLVLAALVLLPAVWWLLRVTPPPARRVIFPPFRLLLGLNDAEETPARTPWWLLLVRILAAGLSILALSEPRLGAPPPKGRSSPLVLLVDNGWTAAHAWETRRAALDDALAAAARAERPVAILATADPAPSASLLDAGGAQRAARDIEPVSWIPARASAARAVAPATLPVATSILGTILRLSRSSSTTRSGRSATSSTPAAKIRPPDCSVPAPRGDARAIQWRYPPPHCIVCCSRAGDVSLILC